MLDLAMSDPSKSILPAHYLQVPIPGFGQATAKVNVNMLDAWTFPHNVLEQHLLKGRVKCKPYYLVQRRAEERNILKVGNYQVEGEVLWSPHVAEKVWESKAVGTSCP